MRKKLKSISVDGDKIHIFEGRTLTHQKCAEVYFAGPQGWGITMNISLDSVESFANSIEYQKRFVGLARDKLGIVQ